MLLGSGGPCALGAPGGISDRGAAGGTGKFPGRNKVPQKETGFSSTLVLKFIGPLKGIPLKKLFKALDGTWEVSGVTGKKEARTCFLPGT